MWGAWCWFLIGHRHAIEGIIETVLAHSVGVESLFFFNPVLLDSLNFNFELSENLETRVNVMLFQSSDVLLQSQIFELIQLSLECSTCLQKVLCEQGGFKIKVKYSSLTYLVTAFTVDLMIGIAVRKKKELFVVLIRCLKVLEKSYNLTEFKSYCFYLFFGRFCFHFMILTIL